MNVMLWVLQVLFALATAVAYLRWRVAPIQPRAAV